ncbi:protein kinase domain-containing protein [Saccharothrix variisporea]|uniref:non-specific serine/threonine protein kinase n=1 Tax=Saccharothrix variisporea TaxID=543527 RepID=A0A495XJ93_9PSEU|nr:serine/threonine-protein kinase [Saccharothrix variisporea]RKT74460.1 serine/threonine-protein kinase [Saccharothrix variisporea]
MGSFGAVPGYRVVARPVEAGPYLIAPARRESDDAEVTLRVVREPLDRIALRRFRTEASVLASVLEELRSPLVVPLVDHGQDHGDRAFLVTDPIGTSLADRIAERGPLPADEVRQVVLGVAPALVLLHRRDVLHGGLSPAALVRQPSGRVLLDTPIPPVLTEMVHLGAEGSGHEPPEVLNGGDWTPHAELYAFASAVWTLLSGRPPVTGTRYERLLRLLNDNAPAPSAPGLPESVAALLREALAREPGDRPSSLAAFADRLQRELAHAGDPDRTAHAMRPGVAARAEQAMGSDYTLLEVLGSGSAGQVWRARRASDGREVAVKVLNPEASTDATSRTRLLREHATLEGLDHPHLVKVLDVVIDRGRAAIVMEFVPGSDLRALLTEGRVGRADGARLLAEVASGLAHLHANRIVHRDVKPANILVRAVGDRRTALLTDFGLVKALGDADLTRTGQVLGTPSYLAPELVPGAEVPAEPTPQADVYALGVTIYEVVTGHRLFTGTTDEVLRKHLHEAPPRPPGLSDGAWRFLSSCLAKEPRTRPTAVEVSEFLHDLVREVALTPADPVPGHFGPEPSAHDATERPAPAVRWGRGVGADADDSSAATLTSARPAPPVTAEPEPSSRRRRSVVVSSARRRPLALAAAAVLLGGAVGGALAWSISGRGRDGTGGTTAAAVTTSSLPQPYRLPVTVSVDPDGAAVVSWPEDAAKLPNFAGVAVMQGSQLRAELRSPEASSYRDPDPLPTGCYFVVALGVTDPPPDPAPPSACPR